MKLYVCVCVCVRMCVCVCVCVPAEVEQALCVGDAVCAPGVVVELRHGPALVGLHVLQVKAPDQEVLTPHVLRHQVHLQHTHTHMGISVCVCVCVYLCVCVDLCVCVCA